jgi:predicted Zn-dependent protease
MRNHLKDARIFKQSADLYRQFKDYQSAESMMRKAVELEPQNSLLKRQLGAIIALNLMSHQQTSRGQL